MHERPDEKTKTPQRHTAARTRVQETICQTRAERDRVRDVIADTVGARDLVPPIPKDELRRIAREAARTAGVDGKYEDYLAVLVNNELWRASLAKVPMDRRLLLLPKCMRNETECQGEIDEFGLLCALCGNCAIHDFKSEAERLGYVVLVAEGSPLVMALIETGQVEAVVGVSCLSVLEEVFPYMEAGAITGVAIPLLHDGCAGTHADLDWMWDAIYLTADGHAPGINIEALRKEVRDLFTQPNLDAALGPVRSDTEKIGRDWLAQSGKRWRPFLTACVYQALQENGRGALPAWSHKLLVAVECFHKASLIHDDIEDNDRERYGAQTLHERFGIPIALNAGDFLVGEGYRLLSELDLSAEQKTAMHGVAAAGHRTLCMGQGAELFWLRDRKALSVADVLSIFREKTAPAFEVALRLGEIAAGMNHGLGEILHEYSDALGVAYQIRDDIADSGAETLDATSDDFDATSDDFDATSDDFDATSDDFDATSSDDLSPLRPSVLLALALDHADRDETEVLGKIWNDSDGLADRAETIRGLRAWREAGQSARAMLHSYQRQAVHALDQVRVPSLKLILRRVIGKIFDDGVVMGCCSDYQTGDAPDRTAGDKTSE